jgi:hypothetical protein
MSTSEFGFWKLRKALMNARQSKNGTPKLNGLEHVEIFGRIDEKAEAVPIPVSGVLVPLEIRYRLIVTGIGIVYDGDSVSEARRQFRMFVVQSKTKDSNSARCSVILFKHYEIVWEYHPPDSVKASIWSNKSCFCWIGFSHTFLHGLALSSGMANDFRSRHAALFGTNHSDHVGVIVRYTQTRRKKAKKSMELADKSVREGGKEPCHSKTYSYWDWDDVSVRSGNSWALARRISPWNAN